MTLCHVYILTNETHSLYMESKSPMWVELSAGWSEAERRKGSELGFTEE